MRELSPVSGIKLIKDLCKQITGNLVNESGNIPRRGVVPIFSNIEIVAVNMASIQ